MADQTKQGDRLSPQEMRGWLTGEIADLTKALQLRTQEATAFVTAYAAGEISAEEAEKRLQQYDRRWGEALPGASASKGVSDEEILAAVDRAATGQSPGSFRSRFGGAPSKTPGSGDLSK